MLSKSFETDLLKNLKSEGFNPKHQKPTRTINPKPNHTFNHKAHNTTKHPKPQNPNHITPQIPSYHKFHNVSS